jgi:DNA polymerase III epsilon subunit-like protein
MIRILDTETTGLGLGVKMDVPVSVAVTDVEGTELLYAIVRPAVACDAEALATHGISETRLNYDDVWPNFETLLDERLEELLAGNTILGWNVGYDVRMLMNAAWHAGVVLPKFICEDMMVQYGKAFGTPGMGKKPGEFRWWTLAAAFEQQFPFDSLIQHAHNALGDCRMTAKLYARWADGKLITPASFDGEFAVRLDAYEIQKTYKGDPYIRLYTAGGQSVNVFSRQFGRLYNNGLDPYKLLDAGLPGKINLPKVRIGYITYGKPGDWLEFPDLVRLEPDYTGAEER